MDQWICVKDRLPEIPEGQCGVSVLVAEFDRVFDEINPGCGYTVTEASYSSTRDFDGNRLRSFDGSEREFDFMQIYYGAGGSEWGPMGDLPTHWMYLPNPGVPGDVSWQDIKSGLPQIPDDKYGVEVLVTLFDRSVFKNYPSAAYSVSKVSYGSVRDRYGKVHRMFEGTELERAFMQYDTIGDGTLEICPLLDPVVSWRYLPEHPDKAPSWVR